jgi:hypothetical protein
MKVSERTRQSSIIDLYMYMHMSENELLTDSHSLVNFENKSQNKDNDDGDDAEFRASPSTY